MKLKHTIILVTALLIGRTTVQAQGLVDGFLSPKGKTTLALSYTSNSYDTLLAGKEEVSPIADHNEINQNNINLYANYGITDDLMIVANLPFINAKGNGVPDRFNSETKFSKFQDLSLLVKWRPYKATFDSGHLNFIIGAGLGIPLGYEPNGILGIGNGALIVEGDAGLHLQFNSGIFLTAIGGYQFKGSSKDTFNTLPNGGDFDVPNAVTATGKLGYAKNRFYAESWIHIHNAVDGVDILGPGFSGNFPEVKSESLSLGGSAYYSVHKNIGVTAGLGTLLEGRNTGKFTYYTLGVVCNFHKIQ